MKINVVGFYKIKKISKLEKNKNLLKEFFSKSLVKGVVIISSEGINGTQIFVKYLGVEGEPTQITKLEKSPSSLEWSPDGQYIAFTMHVSSEPALKPKGVPKKPKGADWTKAPQVIDQVDYSQDRIGFIERGYRQLFIVSAEGGTARQITFGEYDDVSSGIAWSKDSKTILFSSYQKPEAEYAR